MQCVAYVNEIAKKFTCVFRMDKFRGDCHWPFYFRLCYKHSLQQIYFENKIIFDIQRKIKTGFFFIWSLDENFKYHLHFDALALNILETVPEINPPFY